MSTMGFTPDGERLVIHDMESGVAFLARLPLANPSQAEAALGRFFDSLLDQAPPVLIYLDLLEQTRVSLSFVAEERSRLYVNKPLPLGDTEEDGFQQVIATWQKVGRAYAHFAELDAEAVDPEFVMRMALSLHRRIYYAGMVIIEHQRARRELPPGAWRALHALYAKAEEWGVAACPVADALDPSARATCCGEAYAMVLLSELAGPYGLAVRDQGLIRRWAGQWSSHVDIAGVATGETLPPFVVDLMHDGSLRPAAESLVKANLRRLETSRLVILLARLREQLRQRIPPSELGLGEDCTAGQCARLLEHLAQPWAQARAARRFRRHATRGIAHVAAGFEAIHFLVSGEEFKHAANTHVYSRQGFDTLFVFRQMADPEAGLEIKKGNQQGVRPEVWQVVNESANGFRLIRPGSGTRVAHGQLLAVCPNDGGHYFLTQITWLMQDHGQGLIAGIAALPGIPTAVAARALPGHGMQGETYSRAFLLPPVAAVGAEQSLVLPHGMYHPGGRMEICSDGASRIILDHVLQEGTDFERVSFSPEN